jgi:phytoene synthase
MQLSNIARDVGEDARAGRLYLPRRWMREAGIDPVAWLAKPVFDAALGGVVQRLLAEADRLYASARPGVARLPRACRPGIGAAGLLYREIGRQVARQGLDSVTSRAVVSRRRKLWLLARALTPQFGDTDGNAAVLPEASYLVEAAAIRPVWPARDTTRVVWLLELFERLERQQRERAANVGVTGAL